MMLFNMLSAAQGGKSIVLLSRHFGLSNRQMTNVVRHYLPILMRGIQKNFAQQGGLTTLLKTLDNGNYGSYYDDPEIYSNPEVRNRGLALMGRALGGDEIQRKILNRIYVSTGIDTDTLQLILPFITTLALSTLYRKAHTQLNPAAMPNQLPYHGPATNAQPQPQQAAQAAPAYQQPSPMQQQMMAQPVQQERQQHIPQPLGQQQQAPQYQQQPQQPPINRQSEYRQPLPGMQPQPAAMPVDNRPMQQQPQPQPQPQQQAHAQQNGGHHPAPSPSGQERLPNIILQAQEAHAQKQRKINKKGRLSRMLKVPFQLTQGSQQQQQAQPAHQQQVPPHEQPQYQQPQYQQPQYQQQPPQQQYYQEQHHTQQLQHAPQNLPQPHAPNRKYVSLQEKLSAQLPWYEQTN